MFNKNESTKIDELKFIVVPNWLNDKLIRDGLPLKTLMDKEALKDILIEDDLLIYIVLNTSWVDSDEAPIMSMFTRNSVKEMDVMESDDYQSIFKVREAMGMFNYSLFSLDDDTAIRFCTGEKPNKDKFPLFELSLIDDNTYAVKFKPNKKHLSMTTTLNKSLDDAISKLLTEYDFHELATQPLFKMYLRTLVQE